MVLIAILAMRPSSASAAEPFRKVLTSASQNLHVELWEMTSRKVTPKSPAAWFVRKVTLHGGKQEGVDLIVVNNGKLEITIVPTRGMGVLKAQMGDVRLGWDAPVKDVVHPQWINLQSRGGLGWLDGFNEWLCRCGLENNGGPGPDKFINNVGDEATMELTLHGKIANLPAQEVEVTVDREPPYRIRVRGRVDEKMFYGPKLELETEISTEPGANSFRIADVITNRGGQEQEFEILYHANFGQPLLEAGATFLAPVERVTPMNERAAKAMATYPEYLGPTAGFIEQVYCLRPLADSAGRTVATLQNRARDRGVSMAYSIRELPYLTLWKNTAAEAEGYVTGIEPGTNFPNHRRIERKLGRVPKLAPGASHRAAIDFEILGSREQVKRVTELIGSIQAGRKPVIDPQPEKKE
ncbi:MAG: aldose 1-epimerase family protein [Verrucomicrobia bacterium]|nr:aldose 1-epimerase family protein [Verrucomicrobiota bacterium]